MDSLDIQTSTICSVATPPGGAIGIVRVSGKAAIAATSALFRPAGGGTLEERQAGTVNFGRIVDPQGGDEVDEVVVSLYRAPRSYTGEDCTEISCHGSAYILHRVVQLLLAQGCRMARPGEYTQRAFLHGKMDLSQAEAVADLIASTTAANHRMAMQQMKGAFSARLKELREKLLHLTSLMELELDFSDHEDLEFASRPELLGLARHVRSHVARLCDSFRLGNALKRGLPVAIVGETNAGKSTLLNALVGERRALVSNVHGTTRDTVEETVALGDVLLRFIDTAGIRATTDEVERMGIARTYEKIGEADIIIWVHDATLPDLSARIPALASIILRPGRPFLLLLNKTDLLPPARLQPLLAEVRSAVARLCPAESFPAESAVSSPAEIIPLSAHSEEDLDRFTQKLAETVRALTRTSAEASDPIVSNARHYEALTRARQSLDRVIEGLENGLSGDFVSQDLRECLHFLGEIIGEITPTSVLHSIFRNFCIGK